MADRRFETSFKQLPGSNEPGLVLGDDNVVYLIKPDGSRVEVGSGGALGALLLEAGGAGEKVSDLGAVTDVQDADEFVLARAGENNKIDGASLKTAFGGVAVISREQVAGNSVTIADGAQADLTWDTPFAGTALLDRTDPERPIVIASGVYAVSASVSGIGLTVGGYFLVTLDLDLTGEDANVTVFSPPMVAANSDGYISTQAALCYYIPAGGVIQVLVSSRDGAASRDFSLVGIVQQLS